MQSHHVKNHDRFDAASIVGPVVMVAAKTEAAEP
jgi:hypothetical protein